MPWLPEEMRTLRQSSVRELLAHGKIVEDQLGSKDLFTCDRCTRADECEWVYYHENVKDHCVWEELGAPTNEAMEVS